jgi:type II secretory pathway pseudopilin PulG
VENNKHYLKNGMTLITLAITIIITIILTGAVLIAVLGQDGIIMNALESVVKQKLFRRA